MFVIDQLVDKVLPLFFCQLGAKIGQGNFGKVYAATHKSTGVVWAIKSINKEKVGGERGGGEREREKCVCVCVCV